MLFLLVYRPLLTIHIDYQGIAKIAVEKRHHSWLMLARVANDLMEKNFIPLAQAAGTNSDAAVSTVGAQSYVVYIILISNTPAAQLVNLNILRFMRRQYIQKRVAAIPSARPGTPVGLILVTGSDHCLPYAA